MPLTTEQQTAVDMTTDHNVSVLHGAPGVGKTYTLRTILDMALRSGHAVSQAANNNTNIEKKYGEGMVDIDED